MNGAFLLSRHRFQRKSTDITRESVAAFNPNSHKALGISASIFHCPTYSLIFVYKILNNIG